MLPTVPAPPAPPEGEEKAIDNRSSPDDFSVLTDYLITGEVPDHLKDGGGCETSCREKTSEDEKEEMSKALLIVGLPGSGKTYLALSILSIRLQFESGWVSI